MNITDLIQGAVASRTTRFAFELLPPLKGDGTRSVFGAPLISVISQALILL